MLAGAGHAGLHRSLDAVDLNSLGVGAVLTSPALAIGFAISGIGC
jgi:hypothetical protein